MKAAKFFGFLATLSMLGYLSFYVTYESVSAIVIKEAEESKKNEIVIKPIKLEDVNKQEEPKVDIDEEKESLNIKTDKFIFIGDSRLGSVSNLSNEIGFGSVDFITTENVDYYWLVNNGVDSLDYILDNNLGNYNIVFNLGINDLSNIELYVDFFNSLAERYPTQNIFVLSVGPLDEGKAIENDIMHINNDDIYNFNVDMMKRLNKNVHMIHVFQELINNGYNTTDGYYFTEDTSISLLKFIKAHIKKLQDN